MDGIITLMALWFVNGVVATSIAWAVVTLRRKKKRNLKR